MNTRSPRFVSFLSLAALKKIANLAARAHSLFAAGILILLALPLASRDCFGDQVKEQANEGQLDVQMVTYNIRYLNRGDGPDHWDNRVASVAELMQTGDVIGLQEATRTQIDDLVERLPEFDWYGVGRDDAQDAGEFSPIFWRKDQFKASQRGTFWLGPDPTAVGKPAWEAHIPRICSWVMLQPMASDGTSSPASFAVFNTHFDHQSGLARLNSAKLLLEKISEIAPQLPVVVMGDLNCRPDSDPIAVLTGEPTGDNASTSLRLVDSISRSETKPQGPTGTWNGFKQIDPQSRIDYVLVRPDSPKVLEHLTADPKTANGRFASDHLPVAVKVRF